MGAAGYDIAPFGTQTVFSRVIGSPSANSSTTHARSFTVGHQVTGSSGIAADDGFSMWVNASFNKYTDAEVGYTRSVQYDLNSISFSIGFNVGRLLRASK